MEFCIAKHGQQHPAPAPVRAEGGKGASKKGGLAEKEYLRAKSRLAPSLARFHPSFPPRLALYPALVVIIWLPHKANFSTKHKADLGVKKDLTDISQYIEITWQMRTIFLKNAYQNSRC